MDAYFQSRIRHLPAVQTVDIWVLTCMCTTQTCTKTHLQVCMHKYTSPESVYFPSKSHSSSGKPEGSVQYLNNSHELEISSGYLLFSNTSATAPFICVGAGVTVSLPKLGTDLRLAQVGCLCRKCCHHLTFCHDCWL